MVFNLGVFDRIKNKSDFDREAEAFELQRQQNEQAKRLNTLREQQMQLGIEQTQQQMAAPQQLDTQALLAKAIQGGGVGALSPQEQAMLRAADVTQLAKQSVDPRGNVVTNRSYLDLLGMPPAQVNQMPPRQVIDAPMQGPSAAPQMPQQMSQQGPEVGISVTPDMVEGLSPYVQEDIKKEAATQRLKLQADIAAKGGVSLTPGEQKIDEDFSKTYNEFILGGGLQGLEQKLSSLEPSLQALEASAVSGASEDLTRTFSSFMPFGRDTAMSVLNPRGREVQQNVEGPIQASLRQTLGAQFTEKEGERVLERTYDPTLDEAVIAKRVRALIKQLRDNGLALQDASQYFEENGTLKGWQGSLVSSGDMISNIESIDSDDGSMIIIVNPQTGEVLKIPPSDLEAAKAEGFVKQ